MRESSKNELSHEEIRRYSRHLLLPEVALGGQKKLKAASVLVIGTGGLGSPVALYLAAAGVGYLAIRWLLKYLVRHTLYVFAAYCTLLSLLTIILVLLRN